MPKSMLQEQTRSKLILIFFFGILSSYLVAQCPIQTQCGSLAVSGGFPDGSNTFFCEGEVVEFENTTDPSQVDTTIINWGDGVIETYVSELVYQHIYDFSADTCLVGAIALNPQITMTVINACDAGVSVNCFITFVQIQVEPVAQFQSDFEYCVGELINFENLSCENGVDFSYAWDFGGLGTSIEETPSFTFDTPGEYTISLTVTNECGEDTYTRNIDVIAPPTAVANVEDGVVDLNIDNPFQVCLNGDTAIVVLEGQLDSENESSYFWTVIQGTPYQWLPESLSEPDSAEMSIALWEEGLFTIVLQTDNSCEQPAYDTLYIEVLGGDFTLNPQEDACVSLEYTPDPLEDNVIYTINDTVRTDFPITLSEGQYIVEVTGASTVCQTVAIVDTFFVQALTNAQISTPDTTVCSVDGIFTFEATPGNGEWRIDGELFDGTLDPEGYDAGTYEITYGNEPCITSDMVAFTIVKADIVMPNDTTLCIDDPSITFTADPPDGEWSGSVVTPAGVFDPALAGEGTFTLYYEIINPSFQSCSNIDSFQVTVTELFVNFMVASCDGTTLCFELVNSSAHTSILWDFDGTGTSTVDAPCHPFPSDGSYDVTATIVNGECEKDTTISITIEPPPRANFTLNYDNDLCSPLAVEIVNNEPNSSWVYEWRLNDSIFSDLVTPDLLFLEAIGQDTLFEISLTVRNDCSIDMQTESLLVRPLPIANFGTDENQHCSGDTILMANASLGSPDSYQWWLNGTLISTDSIEPIISHITDIVDTLEICLITTNFCGTDTLCTDVIVIPTNVQAFFNTSPTTICEGDTVWFTNFATAGVPVFYDFGDNNSTSNANPFHIYDQAGDYLVVQKAFGCGVDTFEKMISVQEAPTATWNNPTFGCPGERLLFENTSQNVMQYEWTFGDSSTISEEASPTHIFNNPGSYEVCLTVFSANVTGCTHTLCQMVEIYEPPTAGFVVTDSLCLGEEIQFASTASADVVLCDYQFGDGNSMALCDPAHEYQSAGLFLVTQIVENANFCKDTFSQQVFIRTLPIPSFEFQLMNGCHPDSVMFTNLSQNADSYVWDFGDNTTSVLSNPKHFYQNPGMFTVTLTAMIDGICSDIVSQVITIDETPQAIFMPDTNSECAGLEVTFNNNSTGTFTDTEWSFGDGFFSFEHSPMHIFDTPGDYVVQLIVRNEDFCADTATFEMTIHEALNAAIETDDVLCNGEQTGCIDLTILSGTMPYNFNWSNGLETEDNCNLPAGNYNVTITDNNACEWITGVELTEPESIHVEVTETVVSCFDGADGSLEIDLSGGVDPYQILWESGATTSLIEDLPAGDYPLTITDGNACVLETTITLSQNQPITYVDSIQHISCFGANDGVLSFENISGGFPPFNVLLMSDDFEAGGVNVTRFDSLTPNVYNIQIEDANGCLETFETEILEPAPIAVNIAEDTIKIYLGESRKLTTFYNANNPSFMWSPPDRLDCLDCPMPIADPHDSQVYTVTMTDENGCMDMDAVAILVEVNRDVFIPTAFTPNGDLRNDVFRIRSEFEASIKNIKVFRIYDRWGELMFEASDFPPNDRQYGWDGTFKGKRVQPGVYVYYAEVEYVDGEVLLWKGDVFLGR
ncbi:MAG: hypothetical protein DHS20C18_28950 [Saprospiraceae bacterium]|nr:MAG: hypothetical protein DHS20C18_28950 [Saprospiraceae bacterium]